MGFKIVIVGATGSEVAKHFVSSADDLPWDLYFCDQDFTAESEGSVESFFQRKKPSVVLSLMVEPGDHPLSSLNNIAAVCSKFEIPVIHQSSYWAIKPPSCEGEIHESVSVNHSPGIAEYADSERTVIGLAKHIVLRSSWILDAEGSGLFKTVIDALVKEGVDDLIVSDHCYGAPVSSEHISDVMVAIIQQILTGAENWGVYHVHSADSCSEAEFCDHLIRQLQKETEQAFAFPEVAGADDERSLFTMDANLIGRKITDDFGIQSPTWRRGFGRLLRNWIARQNYDFELSKTN